MRVRAEHVQHPVKNPRPVLMPVRLTVLMTVLMPVLMTLVATVLMTLVVPVLMTLVVPVVMAALLPVAMLVLVPVARAGHRIHASILRDEMRFRTSTITRYAHMRNKRNNMAPSESNLPHRKARHPAQCKRNATSPAPGNATRTR